MTGSRSFRAVVVSLVASWLLPAAAAAQAQIAVNGQVPPAALTVAAGTTVSVAVSNGPGSTTDWIGLHATGASDAAFTTFRYLNGSTAPPSTGLTEAVVSFTLPVSVGTYEFRFFGNDSFTRLATSLTITVGAAPAQLTVNGIDPPTTVSAGAGSVLVVNVGGGPANPTDWVGLYAAGASDNGFLTQRYLNGSTSPPASGSATATLTFEAPIVPGSYEFRFFAADGFARLATSTSIVVQASTAQLAVNGIAPPDGVTVAAGSVAMVSVSGGPANTGDWVGLFLDGAPDGSNLGWRYLNNTTSAPTPGVSAATLTFTMPVSGGTYQFRFFANDGHGRLATSSAITVTPPVAQLVVNGVLPPGTISVQPDASLTVEISGGPGNATDWVVLAQAGAPDTTFLTWKYLNGSTSPPSPGMTAATLTFTAPATDGTYELRFLASDGFGRLATSTLVNVGVAAPCTHTLAPAAVAADAAGQTGFMAVSTNGPECTTWSASSDAGWVTLGTPIVDQWAGYIQRVLADGPVAYWTFDNAIGGGTTIFDLTGHGLPATLVGGSTVNERGSASLDGSSGRLTVPPSARLTLTSALTVEVWLQTAREGARIIGATNDPWELYVVAGGLVELRLLGQTVRSVRAVTDDEWHMVNATWDGSNAAIYVDGTLDVQTAVSGTLASSAAGLTIGAHPANGDYFEGLLDDVVVFDYALTADQVTDRYLWDNGLQSETSGVFAYTVAPNPTSAPRAAAVTVADRTIPVSQTAGAVVTSVALTSPFPGTTFNTPASLALSAIVASNVPVAWVNFYAGVTLIGSSPASPYQATWSTPAPGNYLVTAIATDDAGRTTPSLAVNVIISNAQSGAGTLAAPIAAPPGGTYVGVQTVTLTAAPGATIRYTSNGASVDQHSAIYTQPIVVPSSASVQAAAFQSGWTQSPEVVETYTITIITPVLAGVSPGAGAAGTQVTISGTGFDSAQGAGSVWLGSKPGTVVTWSETQIVASVATGSLAGIVQVQQNGTVSNSLSFSVLMPAITSVTPTAGAAGTQVTLIGSGFGDTQGAGQVWLGTAAGLVASWSDTHVVVTVASGSSSGNAQILQNGVWSNAVAFEVTGGSPHIVSITPTAGLPGTVITIAGTNFASSQGAGSVWIGGALATINGWSDTQVSATVSTTAATGVVKILQNGNWSNAVTFRVLTGSPDQVTLSPNVISLLVGETRSIQGLDATGAPVSGLAWLSSDPAVVPLSSANPPVITAVAAGNATITAGDASADVTVYAGSALPMGTVLWSHPGNASGVSDLYMAVPNYDAVADVFAKQGDGSVQAITSDGTVAWTAGPLPGSVNLLPDFQGGLVVFNDEGIYRLDGLTGQASPAYTPTPDELDVWGLGEPAIHTDGTVYTTVAVDTDTTVGAWVVGIDPAAGSERFRVPLVNSTDIVHVSDPMFCTQSEEGARNSHDWPTTPTIAGDGYAYLGYTTRHVEVWVQRAATQPFPDAAYDAWDQLGRDLGTSQETADFGAALATYYVWAAATGLQADNLRNPLLNHDRNAALNAMDVIGPLAFQRPCDKRTTYTSHQHVLQIGADGTASDVVVHDWQATSTHVYTTSDQYPLYHLTERVSGPRNVDVTWPYIITNADQGAVLSWQARLSCSENSTGLPAWHTRTQTDPNCDSGVTEHHLTTVATSGAPSDVVWSPGASSGNPVEPLLQLEDGSFAGTASTSSGDVLLVFDAAGQIKWTLPGYEPIMATAGGGLIARTANDHYAFDADGNATGQLSNLPQFQSWLGNTYRYGSVVRVASPPILPAAHSFWPYQGGNASGTGAWTFTSAQLAAFSALNFLWPWSTEWEWGGLVCESTLVDGVSGVVRHSYSWSRLVTSRDGGFVDVMGQTSCAPHGTAVARLHTHPHLGGAPYPSGFQPGTTTPNDMTIAAADRERVFFLMTPTGGGGAEPQLLKYQAVLIPDGQGGMVWSALYNTFKWVNDVWQGFPPPTQ